MIDHVIRAVNLRKSYRAGSMTTEVLRGIDLCVPRGECLFLTGPSGSGKTTLLSILGCVMTADEGALYMLGNDVSRLSAAERARFRLDKIGFVFQRFHLFAALTALENVLIPLDLLGIPRSRSRPRALELLSMVGLSDRATYKATQLSMGQKQRVALARALAGDPEVVLADEPTASLDAEAGHTAMMLLKQSCAELRKTVIVVTHDSRIFSMADRILTLADGQITVGRLAVRARFADLPRQPAMIDHGAA
jgi:putative ABC transport system ATP-binding protein